MREHFDVLILGGGTAGCVVAGRLSEDSSRTVGLVEAGPDYGPYDGGRWPEDLLQARYMPDSHGWGFEDGRASRARVLGGCSSHNACMVVWGSRGDYDEWSTFSAGAWSFASIEPYLRMAESELRTRLRARDELGPWDSAVLEAAAELGYPTNQNFNDPDSGEQASPWPINAVGAVRWNASFAYVDPARSRSNLSILPETLIDRLETSGDRVTAVVVIAGGQQRRLSADLVVLTAGAYGSPAILMRSGIGPEAELSNHSIRLVNRLEGVGKNLLDHSGATIKAIPSAGLKAAVAAAQEPIYRSSVILKARSHPAAGPWDLHLICWTEPHSPEAEFYLYTKLVKVKSSGKVSLASPDPGLLPVIDHGFLSDSGGEDLKALAESIRISRRLFGAKAMSGVLEGDAMSGSEEEIVLSDVGGYFHPVGTCRIGAEDDPMAVVDALCCVHGMQNLVIADGSVMPTIPRANTNLTVAAIAERIAALTKTAKSRPTLPRSGIG